MAAVREADAAAIEHAVGAASRVLGLGRLALALWDPGLTRLSVVAEARAGEVRMLAPAGPLAIDGVGDRAFNLRRTVVGSERPGERGRVAVAVPLCDAELTLGILELFDDAPLAEADVARLEALAPLVTRVVQHSRLVSRLDRERAIVAALADVRAAATQATDPGRCGSLICARLEAILPGVRVSLYVMAPGGGQVEYLAAGSEQACLRRRLEDRAEDREIGALIAGETDFVGTVRGSSHQELLALAAQSSADLCDRQARDRARLRADARRPRAARGARRGADPVRPLFQLAAADRRRRARRLGAH